MTTPPSPDAPRFRWRNEADERLHRHLGRASTPGEYATVLREQAEILEARTALVGQTALAVTA